eukprot:COSAG05_NODE_215_length_13904_cov_87.085911_8_plen_115_part_00
MFTCFLKIISSDIDARNGVQIRESNIKTKDGKSTGQGVFATRDLPEGFEMMYYGRYYPNHDAYDNYFKEAKARGELVNDEYLSGIDIITLFQYILYNHTIHIFIFVNKIFLLKI